ncbi:MAG: metal ABC transporter permease [Proteobacteria bacterium]|nr:metal ABC transporter permease [Pseudomonadota bacterium]
MTISELIVLPFADYAFMKRALAACLIVSIGGAPLGFFMNLRHMALLGDAMSHAILPGVTLAFLFFGLSVLPMTVAALATGLLVALAAFTLTRITTLKEDSSFTLIYLVCLAFGVVMISRSGTNIDLIHILFGNILALGDGSLLLAAGVACFSVVAVCLFYRGFVIECLDTDFMRASGGGRNVHGMIFFVLVVLNLVASFQVLGTLMSLGLMVLPAIAARFWTCRVDTGILVSLAIAALSSVSGLLISYHAGLPAGPSVVLVVGAFCIASIVIGRHGSVRSYLLRS